MSIDMSQFYQVFFDESAEHLENMESLLLSLDLDAPDSDQLNAIFRSAHSIKGGSGTFGFTDMTEVTHVLETLLDRIRKSEIAITAEMVDAFLEAGDVLHGLLEAHQTGEAADKEPSKIIRAKLHALTDGHQTVAQDAMPIPSADVTAIADGSEPVTTDKVHYQIIFPKNEQVFSNESQLENLLEDLANLGTIEQKIIREDEVELSYTTLSSESEITETLSFFFSPEQLKINKLDKEGSANSNDDSYGFFVEPEQLKTNVEESQGYGFFEPIAEPVDTNKVSGKDDVGYGFFEEPEQLKEKIENEQGFGFFVEPETVQKNVENAQGYGFFESPEKVIEKVENERGYGFFTDVEKTLAKPETKEVANIAQPSPAKAGKVVSKDHAAPAAESSIRVSVEKVDQMINLVGELVITQSMLAETASRLDPVVNEQLLSGLTQLERNTRELQESVMSVRMMPINFVFSRFPRVVRDLANKLSKKVQLKMVGENTELDKGLIEKISDPLTHLVRNSLDHGVESPEERIAKGKDPQGTVTLLAAHQGGNIVIQVQDDGNGLNREKILAKAREKNIPVNDNMSDAEVWMLIFAPGFSTAAMVTDVSGRGVGMDVVKKNIEGIGGRVEIASQFGFGSTITIRLPLTLAILDGLSIAVGDQTYIIPLSFITESLQPQDSDIKEISGQGQVIQVRGDYIPVIPLYKMFSVPPKVLKISEGILILLEAEGKKVALFVDELLGQHQVVIKSLETNYKKVQGISGATIMGDGRVAMIMDVSALIKLAQK